MRRLAPLLGGVRRGFIRSKRHWRTFLVPPVKLSIITPSFRNSPWLKLCVASVADQQGVDAEHIVQDAGSDDGTLDWLTHDPRVQAYVEKDKGMYDAINRGLRRAGGEILAYLNCDEQYLPRALESVQRTFSECRTADVLYGDALVTAPDGCLLAFRKAYPPVRAFILTAHLYILTCALFWRREVTEAGNRFDSGMRDLGDMEFVLRLLADGYRFVHHPDYLATFAVTGENRSLGVNARAEMADMRRRAPAWMRALKLPLNAVRLASKLAHGCYVQHGPIEYALHVGNGERGRRHFLVPRVSFRWPAS